MNSLHRHIIVLYILLLATVVTFTKHAQILEIVKAKSEMNDKMDVAAANKQDNDIIRLRNHINHQEELIKAIEINNASLTSTIKHLREEVHQQIDRHSILLRRVEKVEADK